MPAECHIIKFRGGAADGQFRLRVGEMRERIALIDAEAGICDNYVYAGPEEQKSERAVFDKTGRFERKESRVDAVYHIFLPGGDDA